MGYADGETTKRNFQALSEGLKSVRSQCEKQEEEIKDMRKVNYELLESITYLRQQNGILLARFHGTGSTS